MSAVAIGAQIGSTLLGSYGMYQASKMTGKTGEYNQKVYNYNADLKDQDAELILKQAKFDVQEFTKDFNKFQSFSQVAYLKSGVVIDDGTPLEVLKNNANEAQLEIDKINFNAALGERNAKNQAMNLRMQGEMAMQMARMTGYTQRMQAYSSLLSGGAKTYATYDKYYGSSGTGVTG
tara:strand:- start:56 stop:586 length:531 start_codon:yes stop_codon:yes gene_type:complete